MKEFNALFKINILHCMELNFQAIVYGIQRPGSSSVICNRHLVNFICAYLNIRYNNIIQNMSILKLFVLCYWNIYLIEK